MAVAVFRAAVLHRPPALAAAVSALAGQRKLRFAGSVGRQVCRCYPSRISGQRKRRVIAVALFSVAPPLRLGSFHLSRHVTITCMPALRRLMPPLVYVLPLLVCCYFSTPHHRGSENMGAFTLIGVASREFVAFSVNVPTPSPKSFVLPFSVS
jgi:hypothetical protein